MRRLQSRANKFTSSGVLALELTTDLSILERLAEPDGKDVVDVGCGAGALVRDLCASGARVTGVEISEQQLAAAIARDGGSGARYLVGGAQSLPLATGSVDVAVFMRTLHHVPPPDLMLALQEARRVLRPDGIVFVAEPLAEGDYFTLMSIVEDELEVRRAAQGALARAGLAGLDRAVTVDYEVTVRVADLASLRSRLVSANQARGPIFDARRARLADALGQLGEGGEQPGERCFVQTMRADVLRCTV